jgi:hypothetical protein
MGVEILNTSSPRIRCGSGETGTDAAKKNCRDALSTATYRNIAKELWDVSERIVADTVRKLDDGKPAYVVRERCSARSHSNCPADSTTARDKVKVAILPSVEAPIIDPRLIHRSKPVVIGFLENIETVSGHSIEARYGLEPSGGTARVRYLFVLRASRTPEVSQWDLVRVTATAGTADVAYAADVTKTGARYLGCLQPHVFDGRSRADFQTCDDKYEEAQRLTRARGRSPEEGIIVTHAELHQALKDNPRMSFRSFAWITCPWGCCEFGW